MSTLSEQAKERVLARIDAAQDRIITFLQEYVRQKSTNPNFEGCEHLREEQACQEWLRDTINAMGLFDKLDYWELEEGRPNMVAVLKGEGGGKSLMWMGHSDTVPVTKDQAAAWNGDPWSGDLVDGKVWGRGAADMKGGNTAILWAAALLREAGIKLKGDLNVSFVIGEESGRKEIGCNSVLDRGYYTDFAVIPEISNLNLYPVIKGEIYFKVTIQGKATHICNRHLVAQPLPPGVERPGISAIDKMLKVQQAILDLEEQWTLYREHPLVPQGGMFISINQIHGGEAWSSIPESCWATGSLLFNPGLTSEEVIAEVREVVEGVAKRDYWLRQGNLQLEIPWFGQLKEAVDVPVDHPGNQAIIRAFQAVRGQEPTIACSPFVCDANFWFAKGQPVVVFGPGDLSMGVHGVNEHVPVQDVLDAARTFALMAIDWCGVASVDADTL